MTVLNVLNNEAYSVFCIVDIMQGRFKKRFTDLACDGMWDIGIEMYRAFTESDYNDTHKAEYECLEDFVRDKGKDYLAK